MSSRGGTTNGGGSGVQSIPSASRKMVQSLKEIVSCSESEIYATLKDCNMDPNEAVNKLLSQDPFHEVKKKREKKKEIKDSTESRPRGASSTSNRGTRSGADRYVGRGTSTQFNSSDSGVNYGKPAYKKENGTNLYTSSSYSASGMSGNNTNRQQSALSENKVSASAVDVTPSALQSSSGHQPAWVGVPGQISMADIVKKGRPQGKTLAPPNSSHHNVQASPSSAHHDWPSSEDHGSKVSEMYTEPGAEEWPLMEPSQAASVSAGWDSHAESELHPDASDVPFDRINKHSESQTDEVQAEEDDAIENLSANHAESASLSSRKMQEDSSGGASLFENELYTNMGSYQQHDHTFEHQEAEDGGASVSSAAANLQELSISEEERGAPPQEEVPSVVIPNHLQVQTADCSHLSFGSFGSGISTSFSGPVAPRTVRSNLEAPTEADASSVGHSVNRNPEYYGDESLRTASDGNLVHRSGATAGNYESHSASQPETLKQENPEVAHGNQYIFPLATPGYAFENAQESNTAFTHSQMSSQMQNLTPFSNVMPTYTNSLPSTLLAANVNPVREADIPYSPFPQSMPTKYGNAASSINGSSISMAEALKTAAFSSAQPAPQTLPGTSVATGPALPQHLAALHPYSQPTLPLGPFANMIGYPFLPQSYTYMPSGFQQAFAGNSTYHQSLAAVLPQYKNSVSVSSLPQSASVPSGYGAFGSSTAIPSNYPMNPPAGPAGTNIGYDDVMSSQYKDSNHLISLQQPENSAMWLHGPGSRTMSAVPASTYYSYQGQAQQQPGGFRQAQQQPTQNYGGALGYPNFYHSQTGVSHEHQPQNPRDGSLSGSQAQPKQSQQIWQNSY